MSSLTPPPLIFRGTRWSAEELTRTASCWAQALAARHGSTARPVAMVMANRPESIALFFALSSLPATLVLLPPDLQPWRSSPPLPRDTEVVLLPGQRELGASARALGLGAIVLADARASSEAGDRPRFFAMPGIVLFTSGTTGEPRPVFRRTAGLLATARALIATLGLAGGDGIVTSLPLARAFGLHHGLMAASILGSPLGLLERFDHAELLTLFASREFRYWPGMPMMADVLSRCRLPGTRSASGTPGALARAAAPPICVVGARVSAEVATRFESRFGVTLRQAYGTTETGGIAIDASDPDHVRAGTVGRPVRGVDVLIGADPHEPAPPGTPGRIWVSAAASMMEGYGFPPDVEPPDMVDGWWATPDIGCLDRDGYLTIAGRVDDTFRTSTGYLVNPAGVASALEQYPGVSDIAVVPLTGAAGPVLGLLVESAAPIDIEELREHLARSVPAWSRPRVIQQTGALPRLSAGKIDRQACIAILEQALGAPA